MESSSTRARERSAPVERASLARARAIARWLEANEVGTATGRAWPVDARKPERVSATLGAGVSGDVLFFAALYWASGDPTARAAASRGADFLAASLDELTRDEPAPAEGGSLAPLQPLQPLQRASLYGGLAGVGLALHHADRVTGDDRYAPAVERVIEQLSRWAVPEAGGVRWSERYNDVLFGDAGTILALAFLADQREHAGARQLALAGARRLAARGLAGEQGVYWMFRRDRDFNLPNFSHGTAGIAYTLATVAGLAQAPALLERAEEGARYLDGLAWRADGRYAVPYGFPLEHWQGEHAYGWAHGVAGTARLFARLAEASGEARPRWQLRALANTLLESGLPAAPKAPLIESPTRWDARFGRAGALWIAPPLARALGEPRLDALARALEDSILGAAQEVDGRLYWETSPPAFMGGPEPARFCGLFHGAAGIGLSLLQVDAAAQGLDAHLLLPDDPFAWRLGAAAGRDELWP